MKSVDCCFILFFFCRKNKQHDDFNSSIKKCRTIGPYISYFTLSCRLLLQVFPSLRLHGWIRELLHGSIREGFIWLTHFVDFPSLIHDHFYRNDRWTITDIRQDQNARTLQLFLFYHGHVHR